MEHRDSEESGFTSTSHFWNSVDDLPHCVTVTRNTGQIRVNLSVLFQPIGHSRCLKRDPSLSVHPRTQHSSPFLQLIRLRKVFCVPTVSPVPAPLRPRTCPLAGICFDKSPCIGEASNLGPYFEGGSASSTTMEVNAPDPLQGLPTVPTDGVWLTAADFEPTAT